MMIAALAKKLKIKDGMSILILNPPGGYLATSQEIAERVEIDLEIGNEKYPFVQLFVTTKEDLKNRAEAAIKAVEHDGLLWICYPKKSSALFVDLTRDEGWETVKSHGLEAIASIAIDETWSALRFRPAEKVKQRAPREKKEDEKAETAVTDVTDVLSVPLDLKNELEQNPNANDFFEKLAPSYRRVYIEWITSAKRKETRLKRLKETINKLENGFKNPYAK